MIDRKSLVTRHNLALAEFNPQMPMVLGNGDFAITVDITGLQSMRKDYEHFLPLNTMSNWAWHTAPSAKGYSRTGFLKTLFNSHGRGVPYLYTDRPWWKEHPSKHAEYLAQNPHHFCLGYVGLLIDGHQLEPEHICKVNQSLDLWTGLLTSRFWVDGYELLVQTVCHPGASLWAVRILSSLVRQGRLSLFVFFPYGSHTRTGGVTGKDDAHHTELLKAAHDQPMFHRTMDDVEYSACLSAASCVVQTASHEFICHPPSGCGEQWDVSIAYDIGHDLPQTMSFMETKVASEQFWQQYWNDGGALELVESTDIRADELERRIILSQYLCATQSSGTIPPQESGLMYNSWNGKFHLEMHFWHAAHFALWDRGSMLARSMEWYMRILPQAKHLAALQGYQGARWPKCVGPDGYNAPCVIEPFLIWQQPHVIYLAELLYRISPEQAVLHRYSELVLETARFMASFAVRPQGHAYHVLGPPLAPAQERYDHVTTMNPCFELSYWRWGLRTAMEWCKRLGHAIDPIFEVVLRGLPPLPTRDGVYLAAETAPDTFDNPAYMQDHPSMVASLGVLPGMDVDPRLMYRTLRRIQERWDWSTVWAWDYPMLAMTAARLDKPDMAIDFLCMDSSKHQWLQGGGCFQSDELPVYLPGNGGLLLAVAMMAAGWEGVRDLHAPGFPKKGWSISYERLAQIP